MMMPFGREHGLVQAMNPWEAQLAFLVKGSDCHARNRNIQFRVCLLFDKRVLEYGADGKLRVRYLKAL